MPDSRVSRAVLNVAVNGNYAAGQLRLGESLDKMGESADRLFWLDFPGATHQEVPYGFKVDAFLHAKAEGYDQAFWLDASCVLVSPLPWDDLTDKGYWLHAEGWTVGQWINEEALSVMNLTRAQANEMTLIEGKIMGLDFRHPLSQDFLREWKHYRDEGAFNGDWSDHRHDITVGAVVAHRMSLELNYSRVVLGDPKRPVAASTIVVAQGV